MSPEALLAAACAVLRNESKDLEGIRPRAAALLARQALEAAISDVLARRAPGAEKAPARARLLCLPTYVSTTTGHEANFLWGTLTRVCHQHVYDLAPTAPEIEGWLLGVDRVIAKLNSKSAPSEG